MTGLLTHIISLPPLLTQFLVTTLLSFIIGLQLHSYRHSAHHDLGFGTTRTFTLIGILGFVLYSINQSCLIYSIGLIGLSLFLAIYYSHRTDEHVYSLINLLIAILTYLLAPVVILLPNWFVILYVVAILLLLGEKPKIRHFSDTLQGAEIITFSKFMIMAGVILPLLPSRQIAPFITVTYYQVWLAVLVASTLSYLSYLAQTYFFKEKGLFFTGLLGGLYSSTATTVILARRASQLPSTPHITQALIMATAMMYLRLLILIYVLGHSSIGNQLLVPFGIIFIASVMVIWLVSGISQDRNTKAGGERLSHPLEFKTALIFSGMFVFFTVLISLVLKLYGGEGVYVLSFLVGLTDIDPFILSLLGGSYAMTNMQVIQAIIIATASNNVMKAIYALVLNRNRYTVMAVAWLILLFLFSLSYIAVLS